MCLIIFKPVKDEDGVIPTVDPSWIESSVKRNSNSVGIMYVLNSRVQVDKMVGTKDNVDEMIDFCKTYDEVAEAYLMHHRMSTHGVDSLENTHPFKVLSIDDGDPIDLYMMHNGIISEVKSNGKTDLRSDTRAFVEDILQPILKKDHTLLEEDSFKALIKGFIGGGNKLTFLDNEGNVTIINEQAGEWKNGVWLSNNYSINSYSGNNIIPRNNNYNHGYPRHNTNLNQSYSNVLNHNKSTDYDDVEDNSCIVGKTINGQKTGSLNSMGGTNKKYVQHSSWAHDYTEPLTRMQIIDMDDSELDDLAIHDPQFLVDSIIHNVYSDTKELLTRLSPYGQASLMQEMIEQLADFQDDAVTTFNAVEDDIEDYLGAYAR